MVIFVLTTLLGVYGTRSINENNLAQRQEKSVEAFYIAEAGIQKAIWVISNNPQQIDDNDWLTARVNVNNSLGNGSFQVQISGDASAKTITNSGTVSSITRQIQVQVQNSWLSKIPAAIYAKGVGKIKFHKRDEAYIDGGSMPGIYSIDEVKIKKEGEGRIDGNPPILENQEVPKNLADGIWEAFDINRLREIAKANGTYFSADTSGDEYNNPYNKKGKYTLPVKPGQTNGVFFFDAKNGEPLDDDEINPKNEIRVKLKGTTEPVSGVIVVVGDLDIKDTNDYDFLFNGVILVLDDLKIDDKKHHRRGGDNDSDVFIKGAILCDNIIEKGKKRKKKPVVKIKNATIEYDADSIATAAPATWSIVSGSWQEL
jgi:Tfp pilus assembly protein PilX